MALFTLATSFGRLTILLGSGVQNFGIKAITVRAFHPDKGMKSQACGQVFWVLISSQTYPMGGKTIKISYMIRIQTLLLFAVSLLFSTPGQSSSSNTGRDAAMKYFTRKRLTTSQRSPQSTAAPSGDHILALSVGNLLNSKSYNWLGEDPKGWNLELFYQNATEGYFGQGYHLELQKFSESGSPDLSKVSFLVSFTFPRRLSFPVYLGAAAGPGYFFQQKQNESEFTIDYKAWLGLRLLDDRSQYFLQSGVKNHVHVLSDGQFIGWFISSGVAYKF